MNGSIAWFARNPAVANLLMVMLLLSGWIGMSLARQETLPNVPLDRIGISVQMEQASPALVETLLCAPVEQAIAGIEGLSQLTSEAYDGLCMLRVDVQQGYQTGQVLDQVRVAVDGIRGLPEQASRPLVQELVVRNRVMRLLLVGAMSELQLYQLANRIRQDLLRDENLTIIDIENLPAREVAIEVPRENLHRFQLTLEQMAAEIRRAAQPVTAGVLHSEQGDLLLAAGQRISHGGGYMDLPLRDSGDGSALRVSDVGSLHDGFERTMIAAWHNGQPAVAIDIYRVGAQQVLDVADAVQSYLQQAQLPDGATLQLWEDDAAEFRDRTSVLWENGWQGLVILLLLLSLALGAYLAGWIALGIPVAMLGAVAVLPLLGESINTISLFAFILVLGIVVDDAIVTGESAYSYLEREQQGLDSIIHGVKRVSTATIFGVLTTIIAFTPMLTMTSHIGRFGSNIAVVVIFCLIFSLIETKLILPAHLRHIKLDKKSTGPIAALQNGFDRQLKAFVYNIYRPALQTLLAYRYVSLAVFVAGFIVVLSLVPAGIVRMVFFPDVPSDQIVISLRLPPSAPYQLTHDYALKIEAAATTVNERYRERTGEDVDAISNIETLSSSDDQARIWASLVPSEQRQIDSVILAQWWREAIGPLPGIKQLSFDAKAGPGEGVDLDVALESDDLAELQRAAQWLKAELQQISGVFDIRDTFGAGAPEVDIRIKPAGELLGLGQAEIARQVRQAFFGAEIQRFQRGRHEVRVYARLPLAERNTLETLEQLWIKLPSGERVPFSEVAEAQYSSGISSIKRVDRKRVVNIQTGIDKATIEPDAVVAKLDRDVMPTLLKQFPAVSYYYTGQVEEQQKDTRELQVMGSLVLLLIFAALAIPLKSYIQPLYIMSAIPFSVAGAIIGHWLTGNDLSMLSIIGVVALAGVVVNDSLVLVDFINQKVSEGEEKLKAVVEAGQMRFRAVILTSLTTFLGLLPIQLETSIQAQFIKPMATSVGFGILFATAVTLFLVPILFFIAHDISQFFAKRLSPKTL